jgi:NADH-quinone oxidoreductase subunit J
MEIYDIIFYLFAALTIVSAFFVVTSRNIVHAAFYLLFTFFGVTGIYVLLGADFVAIVQLIVYVGGILILLIFGVMITNKITEVDIKTGTAHTLPAAIGVGLFTGIVGAVILNTEWKVVDTPIPEATLSNLGELLLTEYVLIFELLGILLLVALVGAASMARK